MLSQRSYQQQDLGNKLAIYAHLRVAEYVLVDVTGRFLPRRLLIKRLQADSTWRDEQDPDGGITSHLGFRLLIEPDGGLRFGNAKTRLFNSSPDRWLGSTSASYRPQSGRPSDGDTRQASADGTPGLLQKAAATITQRAETLGTEFLLV